MATTHHPAPTHAGFGHHHEWIWIALGAVLVGLVAASITWYVNQPDTETATLPSSVTGFQYEDDATAGHLMTGSVTAPFVGESGDLHAVIAPIGGFEGIHEVTPIHMPPADPVTVEYYGNSGELNPEPYSVSTPDHLGPIVIEGSTPDHLGPIVIEGSTPDHLG